jgi:hypothetical protein
MKFRKKPVVIEATQWDGTYTHAQQLEAKLGLEAFGMNSHPQNNTVSYWCIDTLEGRRYVTPGDWIITGVKGEFYLRKDEIFKMTYEEVEQ